MAGPCNVLRSCCLLKRNCTRTVSYRDPTHACRSSVPVARLRRSTLALSLHVTRILYPAPAYRRLSAHSSPVSVVRDDILRPAAEVDFFLEHGYLVVKHAFSPDKAAEFTKDMWVRLGMDPDDPATWDRERVHMPVLNREPVATFAPKVSESEFVPRLVVVVAAPPRSSVVLIVC